MGKAADDLLRRAGASQRLAMERALTAVDVTPAQFAVLEWLQEEAGLSGAEIARRERLTPPTSSVIIANLERKGLVSRHVKAGRGRTQHLELTASGRKKAAAGGIAVEPVRRRLVDGIDLYFEEALMAWLRRLTDFDV